MAGVNVNVSDHFENGHTPLALLAGELLVDEAGGLVHYHSKAGEVLGDGGNTVAVAPMLERLLTVSGALDSEEGEVRAVVGHCG